MIEDPRGRIEYQEQGTGRTVVLVPGSCSTGAAWRPVIKALGGRYRAVTTSLLGYGLTEERRTERDPSLQPEAEIVESVIERAGGGVHLVGHSFGGVVALMVALRKRIPVLSLTVLEAPLPSLLRQCGEASHYRAFRAMTDAYFARFHSGDREAIGAMIDFYGGEGTFASWPEPVRAYAVATTAVNILDWACAYDDILSPEILSAIDVPVSVAVGAASHPAICRANGLVATSIGGATFRTIGGAAHFMISTHAAQVADLIAETALLAEMPALRAAADRATCETKQGGCCCAGESPPADALRAYRDGPKVW